MGKPLPSRRFLHRPVHLGTSQPLHSIAHTPSLTHQENSMPCNVHTEMAHESPSSGKPPSPLVPKLKLDEVPRLKEAIKKGNEKLYKMQAQVLAATWTDEVPGQAEYLLDLTRRANELEEEVSQLCMQLKTARAITDGKMGLDAWQKTQQNTARSIEASIEQGCSSSKTAAALASEAGALEKEAEMMVRELRASLARGDHKEYIIATRVHSKELDQLEQQLAAARRGEGTSSVEDILPKIKACHDDFCRLQEMSEASATDADTTECSDDEDEGLDWEEVETISVGDKVRLVCDDEDGFTRGDTGIVVEYDPSIAYPYRVQKKGAVAFFKATDIIIVERAVRRTTCPLSPRALARKAKSSPHPSPYADTPYGSESGEDSFEEDVDLEKGKCRSLTMHHQPSFMVRAKDLAVTLNPLAV